MTVTYEQAVRRIADAAEQFKKVCDEEPVPAFGGELPPINRGAFCLQTAFNVWTSMNPPPNVSNIFGVDAPVLDTPESVLRRMESMSIDELNKLGDSLRQKLLKIVTPENADRLYREIERVVSENKKKEAPSEPATTGERKAP